MKMEFVDLFAQFWGLEISAKFSILLAFA